jgi:hypothetical protein
VHSKSLSFIASKTMDSSVKKKIVEERTHEKTREKRARTEEKVDELLKRDRERENNDHQEARKEKNGLVEYTK